MVLQLYGYPLSTCTKRVAVVLHEKKIPFEFHLVDMRKGEHKAPEHLAKQPFGQVPYIVDDGFLLHESRAIARYLEEKYPDQGTSLLPKDLKARALVDQAISIESFDFDVYASQAVYAKVFRPMRGLEPDNASFDQQILLLDDKLAVYDKILSNQKYMGGDSISLADLFHLPYGVALGLAKTDIMSKYPNVNRWFSELRARPTWQAIIDGVKSVAAY